MLRGLLGNFDYLNDSLLTIISVILTCGNLASLQGYEDDYSSGDTGDSSQLYNTILTELQDYVETYSSNEDRLKDIEAIAGLHYRVKFNCGCGKSCKIQAMQKQYNMLFSTFTALENVEIGCYDDPKSVMELCQQYKYKLPKFIKSDIESSLMFPDIDHYNQCPFAKNYTVSLASDKEPEILCLDIKWSSEEPLDKLLVLNSVPNNFKLNEIYK